MSEEYMKLLRDPRWQEKRLRVMEAAGFKCQECGAADKTFNVNHGYYEKGKKPWEYPICDLRCLCEPCHERWHEVQKIFRRRLASITIHQMVQVIGYFMALELPRHPERMVTFISNDDAQGFADGLGLTLSEVLEVVGNLGFAHGETFLDLVVGKTQGGAS